MGRTFMTQSEHDAPMTTLANVASDVQTQEMINQEDHQARGGAASLQQLRRNQRNYLRRAGNCMRCRMVVVLW